MFPQLFINCNTVKSSSKAIYFEYLTHLAILKFLFDSQYSLYYGIFIPLSSRLPQVPSYRMSIQCIIW
jgi:hypothetical protein